MIRTEYNSEDTELMSRRYILSQGGAMISTKVDVDGYLTQEEESEMVTTSTNTVLTSLAKAVIDQGREKIHARYGHDLTYQTMTVLACIDLPDTENEIKHYRKCKTVGSEQVLYKLRSYKNGTFDIQVSLQGLPVLAW